MTDAHEADYVSVPVAFLRELEEVYLRGHCPIKDGWGDCPPIEKLVALLPALTCDNCGKPVQVRGVREPEYVHVSSGSPFCMDNIAVVDGQRHPPTNSHSCPPPSEPSP